jgi:hypothetical protein
VLAAAELQGGKSPVLWEVLGLLCKRRMSVQLASVLLQGVQAPALGCRLELSCGRQAQVLEQVWRKWELRPG